MNSNKGMPKLESFRTPFPFKQIELVIHRLKDKTTGYKIVIFLLMRANFCSLAVKTSLINMRLNGTQTKACVNLKPSELRFIFIKLNMQYIG